MVLDTARRTRSRLSGRCGSLQYNTSILQTFPRIIPKFLVLVDVPALKLTPTPRRTHCKHGHEFTPENTFIGGDGFRRCKTCMGRHSKDFRERNPNKTSQQKIDAHLRQRYGLTQERKDGMLAEQGGCALCGVTKPVGYGGKWHVDHDHATDEVRAILCPRCNLLLGMLKDDLSFIQKIVEYLKKFGIRE